MDKEARVVELLRKLTEQKDVFFYGVVKKITGDTCTVMIGDLELSDVRLKATNNGADAKLLITPTIDSIVIIGANGGDLRSTFIIKVDDPEKIFYTHGDITIDIDGSSGNIKINGGNLGGLIKIEELVNRLNAIEDYVKDFKTKYDSHTHLGVLAGNGSSGNTASVVGADPTKTQRDPLEDTKIKH